MAATFLLCSDCFINQGLRSEARRLGDKISKACPNCGSNGGAKLRKPVLERLVQRFFVQGTTPHGVGGRASILKFNPHADVDDVELDGQTTADWTLIKSKIGGRLFYNAPRLWEIGITEHYDDELKIADSAITEIVDKVRVKTIPAGFSTFRIRKNLTGDSPLSSSQYAIPPQDTKRVFGRFDSPEIPLLYTSPNLPVCLHECRVAITDDIFVATFKAKKDLILANLAADYDQDNPPPSENLAYFFNGITLSRDDAVYAAARRITAEIKKRKNVDGFIVNSFFTDVAQEAVGQNYCFFEEPIREQRLMLHSLNRLHLKTVSYDYIYGPTFPTVGPAPNPTGDPQADMPSPTSS